MEKRLLNISRASTYLGFSKRAIYQLVWRKKIPYVKLSPRKLGFLKHSLDRWLEEHEIAEMNRD